MSYPIHLADASYLKARVTDLQEQVGRQQLGLEVNRIALWVLGAMFALHLVWEIFEI